MMKRGQRILSLILAWMLCVSMLPVSAMALELPELDVLERTVEVVDMEDATFLEQGAEVEETFTEVEEDILSGEENTVIEQVSIQLEASDYLSSCTSYKTHVNVTMTQASYIKSLPCSKDGPSAKNVGDAVITVTAIVQVSAVCRWFMEIRS